MTTDANAADTPALRVISWNIARSADSWKVLLANEIGADIALLQEATRPGLNVPWTSPALDADWRTESAQRKFCAAVSRLSDRVTCSAIPTRPLGCTGEEPLAVSIPGTLAAVTVTLADEEPITVVSAYSLWDKFAVPSKWSIQADTSAHRLISDICHLIGSESDHRIIVAGDWNIYHGYGDRGSSYWKRRYDTVFESHGSHRSSLRRAAVATGFTSWTDGSRGTG